MGGCDWVRSFVISTADTILIVAGVLCAQFEDAQTPRVLLYNFTSSWDVITATTTPTTRNN